MLQKKGGMLIQFINSSCVGATNLIGGIRISLDDIRRIPAYFARYKSMVKLHTQQFLGHHFREKQCSTGATETLAADNYGLLFTMASLSPQGIILNPSKRSKGPLFFCIFPGLTEPVFLKDDNEEEVKYAYVVNAYIHLLPMGQGQSVDKAAKKAAKPTPPNPKKPRMQPYQPDLQSTMSSLVNER